MDTANAITPLMLESSTSQRSAPSEQLFRQKLSVGQMQAPGDFLEIGRQIIQLVLTSPSLETVLPRIAATLGRIFQVDFCLIAPVVNHQATSMEALWCAVADSEQVFKGTIGQLESPILEAILTTTEPLVISDQLTAQRWPVEDERVQAVLGIPTQFQSSINGMIILGQRAAHTWSDSEKELLKVVSEPVAMAISQVQLHQQVLLGNRYQTLINPLTQAIRNASELNHILQLAISGISQLLQVDQGYILFLKYADPLAKTRSLKRIPKAKVTVASEWSRTQAQEAGKQKAKKAEDQRKSKNPISFWLSECQLCQQAFTQAPEPTVTVGQGGKLTIDPTLDISPIFDLEAMPAVLIVPLVGATTGSAAQGTILGFLVLQHHQYHFWQAEELELVKWVSAQTSTAIIQNQTLVQVQSLVEKRTAQLQGSLEVQAKLYEKTRQQIDQLRLLNQLKDEFVDTISHELRTPLTKMLVAIRMLRQPEIPPEKKRAYLEILDQECTQEINLINDLLALQKLESRKFPIQLQQVDLKETIQDLAQSFEEKWADKGLTLAVHLPERLGSNSSTEANTSGNAARNRQLMIQTDANSLTRILLELLTNAGKYSAPETMVHLSVTHEVSQQVNQIVITLKNTGAGISPTEQKTVFDKFTRGKGVTQQALQGTGLGLALVKCLVEHLNGAIAVSSCADDNTQCCETCFTLTLPQVFAKPKV